MVSKNLAVYEPPKQTKSVILYWRSLDEWAEALHDWVRGYTAACSIFQLKRIILGKLDRTAEHYHDILRYNRAPSAVTSLRHPDDDSAQSYYDIDKD